ncbi:hypothetical protein KIK84_10365 [Curvibacter sp. CHRR-16]|uniref:AAA family ATPase n=1 Tax=Curvibacter sp. CHRR-16 TaxID=2835872 RepID=UPI001BDA9B95|nr:hypothetical protein [Curvibacter sp. CHRR-16]MBT0570734.1 hypothetical protein [Curvibacter sp. CHRR-16]
MNDTLTSNTHEGATEGIVAFVSANDGPAVADLFTRLQQPCRVLEAGGALEALAWAGRNALPRLLVVDFSHERYPLQAMTELTAAFGPAVQIIVLGERQDVNLYRQLLLAGALDYLVKPLSLDLLASVLERAEHGQPLGHGAPLRAGRTVALFGATGGAGVSTVTALLGQLVAGKRETPCVLVDFDRSKGDLPLLLGTDADAGLAALLEASDIDPRMLARSLRTLPAAQSGGVPQRLHLLSQQPSAHVAVHAERVLELGGALSQLFSVALWDMPSCHTEGVAEVLDHADVRVLLCEMNVTSARHAHRLVQRYGDERTGQSLVLVHNPTRPTGQGHGHITRTQFEEFVGRPIDVNLPYAGARLANSVLAGAINPSADPAFTQALLVLADRILGRKAQVSAPAPAHWLQKLLGTAVPVWLQGGK